MFLHLSKRVPVICRVLYFEIKSLCFISLAVGLSLIDLREIMHDIQQKLGQTQHCVFPYLFFRQTEAPRYHRGPQFVAVARRQESSNMYLNPAYATNKSLRNGRGRHMNEEDRRGPKTRESGTSVDALYY